MPVEKTRLKLILLALAKRLPKLPAEELCCLCQDIMFFNYFDIKYALSELTDKGLILLEAGDDGKGGVQDLCSLSAEGAAVLKRLESSLSPAILRTLETFTEENHLASFSESKVEVLEDGEWKLTLRAGDGENTLMQLELRMPSEAAAQQMKEKWPEKAAEIYQLILRNLSGELSEKASEAPSPAVPDKDSKEAKEALESERSQDASDK